MEGGPHEPDHRVVHDRLVGLILEVGFPAVLEAGGRPRLEFFQFLLGRTDLDAGFDTVGGQRPRSLDIPLLENAWKGSVCIYSDPLGSKQLKRIRTLLYLGISPSKIVEGLRPRLGSVDGEGQVMVLKIETDTREVDDRLDTDAAELLRVA